MDLLLPDGIEKVYIAIHGTDISQAVRPLIQSFFGNIGYTYEYFEESSLMKPEDEGVSVIMSFSDRKLSAEVFLKGESVRRAESENAPEDIREYRYEAGRLVYDLLHELTGKELPWGIMVGIRPTKHIYEYLEKGLSKDEIRHRFRDELYVSEKRTETAYNIAERERRILKSFDYRNGYSLYIGIPFCPTTCLYCSFTSYPVEKFGKYMDDYLTALLKEMEYVSHALKGRELHTIYVGGGTPTALDERNLERLLDGIHRYFPVNSVLEFSVEAGRPDSITEGKLKLLKKYGVNRISINPQTLVQRTLDIIGRRHTVAEVYDAFEMARACGHDNINMDLIAGLTGESTEDMKVTLEGVDRLKPESLTVHTLAIKRAARLKLENDKYKSHAAKNVSGMLDLTMQYTAENGLNPYYLYRQKNMAENLENTGYALEGRECLYNILIMEEKQTILALGAGATTKYVYDEEHLDRVENVKSLTDYIERTDEMIERKRVFLEKAEKSGTP